MRAVPRRAVEAAPLALRTAAPAVLRGEDVEEEGEGRRKAWRAPAARRVTWERAWWSMLLVWVGGTKAEAEPAQAAVAAASAASEARRLRRR